MTQDQPVTLLALNQRLQRLITDPSTQFVWVTAELSDVQVRGGHCYMELLDKNERGEIVAKARAAIWANVYRRVAPEFRRVTGTDFATGIKVMVCASAALHPVYGLSLVVSAVDCSYTLGEKERRRREILARLGREGILNANRSLTWPAVPQRIAVISAPGAAGYGDFINQLFTNPSHLRFHVGFYPAIMQGDRAAASISAALGRIARDQTRYDGVVIIRGGGATSDLECYESYELARDIAGFPLPVIIGIGHERDITLLDFVANMRVKTPTAAAEWFISLGDNALSWLDNTAMNIISYVQRRISGEGERLTWCEGQLTSVAARRIVPEQTRLGMVADSLQDITAKIIMHEHERLDSRHALADVLSPRATLRRGFSYTRVNGATLRSVAQAPAGTRIQTVTADGIIDSQVTAARPDGQPAAHNHVTPEFPHINRPL